MFFNQIWLPQSLGRRPKLCSEDQISKVDFDARFGLLKLQRPNLGEDLRQIEVLVGHYLEGFRNSDSKSSRWKMAPRVMLQKVNFLWETCQLSFFHGSTFHEESIS